MRGNVLKAIKILDADYGPLRGRFKQGVMFDIDAPIVVAVGPNGAVKLHFYDC